MQLQRALTQCVLALGEGAQREDDNRQAAYHRARGEANDALAGVRLGHRRRNRGGRRPGGPWPGGVRVPPPRPLELDFAAP